jgi:hypothetical protein
MIPCGIGQAYGITLLGEPKTLIWSCAREGGDRCRMRFPDDKCYKNTARAS